MVINIEKQTIIDKVNELNQKLEQLGIPQLRYVFDKEFEVVQLLYTCDYYTDWVGSVVDGSIRKITTDELAEFALKLCFDKGGI